MKLSPVIYEVAQEKIYYEILAKLIINNADTSYINENDKLLNKFMTLNLKQKKNKGVNNEQNIEITKYQIMALHVLMYYNVSQMNYI